MDAPQKLCTKCGELKPATTKHFTRRSNVSSGLEARCKDCERIHREENKERILANKRRWKTQNREKVRAGNIRYENEHHELVKMWKRRSAAKRGDAKREYDRQYAIDNRDARNANETRRRAHKHAAKGVHTAADIKRQFDCQGGKCLYCGVCVADGYHVDHVVPLSRGGSNGPENIVIACAGCNTSKANKLPYEWRE